MAHLDAHENHAHTTHAHFSWEELFQLEPDMTTAAILLGREYGFTNLPDMEPTAGLVIRCGFSNQATDAPWSPHPNSKPTDPWMRDPKWTCVLDTKECLWCGY